MKARTLLLATAALLAPLLVAVEPAEAQATAESGTADWRMVRAGGNHTCGIRTTGRLYCWGYDTYGQLGDGGTPTDRPTPVQVAGGHTDWTTVATGGDHTCGRRSTGRLYCWGRDTDGQVGDGGIPTDRAAPVQVAGGHTDWTTVTTGTLHTCGRRSTGRLYCWGRDNFGQVGNGSPNASRAAPVQVAGGATNWATVAAGANHTCARRTTGRLYCWGWDVSAQLGDGGPNTDQPAPVAVAGGATNWTTVSAGGNHTCALRTTGRLYCWGGDFEGQLGNGPAGDQTTPFQVAGGATNWSSVSAGGYYTCARRSTGRLYCWGDDPEGQLGDGGANTDQPAPVEVDGGATSWTAVSAGGFHTCARRSTRRIYCWGDDTFSQLGDGGTDTDQPVPVEVEA